MSLSKQTLETLEFPKICERLARLTSFSASRALALELLPSTDPAEVAHRLRFTGEARLFLDSYPEASIGGAHDVRPQVQHAARGGTLEAASFLDILSTLVSMRHLRGLLFKLSQERFPLFSSHAGSLPELLPIENEIDRIIGDGGTVLDHASPALNRIRNDIRIANQRIQDRLHSIVSSSHHANALQEALVTVRGGRYVVPVKAAYRRSVPGLVHDQSASGATLYIEPMAVVELNNHLRECELAEQQEIQRILSELSLRVGRVSDAIIGGVETLALLDLSFAQARYADILRCVEPILTEGHGTGEDDARVLELHEARHPLLDQQTVVPIDVWLGGEFQLLLITGPNTGGKTVALKTVGLLALMTQAGLHIPAREPAHMPVFHQIFADIGDEQSIEQSLSTFSSHMRNIIRMLHTIEQTWEEEQRFSPGAPPPATLVLLDEIGAGTDPAEGAALAQAIIERMLQRGCVGIITTHYAELKVFAHNTPGVRNACVEFDSETLAPTYVLTIGLPGRSNALAIAARLGLDTAIVERARSSTSHDARHVERLLEDIHHKSEAAAAEQERAEQLRADAEKYRDRLAEQYRAFEATREEHMKDALHEVDDELRKVRTELRRLREQARREAHALQQVQQIEQELEQTQEAFQKVEQHVQQQLEEPSGANVVEVRPLGAGDTVLVRSIGLSGEIVEIDDEDEMAEVQVGSFRVRVGLDDLRREKSRQGDGRRTAPARQVSLPAAPDVSMTLDMRGWRAADVADGLERYLNDAYLCGLPHVRLIHGKGSGTLRQVVHELLRRHPLVHSFEGGGRDGGGEGVTVARLVER